MHVRSLSEWAPLCIGPYAQANVLNKSLSLIAGLYRFISREFDVNLILMIRANWIASCHNAYDWRSGL